MLVSQSVSVFVTFIIVEYVRPCPYLDFRLSVRGSFEKLSCSTLSLSQNSSVWRQRCGTQVDKD